MSRNRSTIDVELDGVKDYIHVVIEHAETQEEIGSFVGSDIAIPDVDDSVVAADITLTGEEPDDTSTTVEESSDMYRVVDRYFTLANVDIDTDQREGRYVESQVHISVLSQEEYEEGLPE